MIHDAVNQDADPDECEQERDRGDEHAPARPVGDGGADQESQPGQLQQHQQHGDHQAANASSNSGQFRAYRAYLIEPLPRPIPKR